MLKYDSRDEVAVAAARLAECNSYREHTLQQLNNQMDAVEMTRGELAKATERAAEAETALVKVVERRKNYEWSLEAVQKYLAQQLEEAKHVASLVGRTDLPSRECRIERADGSLFRTDIVTDLAVEYVVRVDGKMRIAERRDETTFVLTGRFDETEPSSTEFPNAKNGQE